MSEISFLTGKVRKWTLPLIQGRPGPDAPNLKRLLLPQGQLDQIHNSEEGMRYLALLELVPGTARGNHYHKVKEERIYVIAGELLILVEDIQTRERARLTLQPGDLAGIPTGIAHALHAVSPGRALEFSAAPFDPADNHPWPLV